MALLMSIGRTCLELSMSPSSSQSVCAAKVIIPLSGCAGHRVLLKAHDELRRFPEALQRCAWALATATQVVVNLAQAFGASSPRVKEAPLALERLKLEQHAVP
jgi:hypothetical protein